MLTNHDFIYNDGVPIGSHMHQVHVVSHDRVANTVTRQILSSAQIPSFEYGSPSQLIQALPLNSPACFLVDFMLPEMNGLQLMDKLRRSNHFHPCIFLSSRIEPELIVLAMNKGAFGFVKKPFKPIELVDVVQRALNLDQSLSPHIEDAIEYRECRQNLTKKEQLILSLLEIGKTARNIGMELNLSYRTVENHRARIFKKLEINQGSQLIKKVTTLNLLRAQGIIE